MDAPRTEKRSVRRGRAIDDDRARTAAVSAALLFALTGLTAAVYVWTKAPLYNAFGTIDPWLYTALWTNFEQTYESFPRTYYISRIPWIVPGYALNGLFDARTASLVLHSVYFLAGGVFFYLLCRRWLGIVAAAIGYVALIGSQMYFNAHRWDYQEGGVLTYMIGAYAFSLVGTRSILLRGASLALGGAFAAALVTTRVIDGAHLMGLPLLYVAVTAGATWAVWLKQFARDVAGFAIGAGTLLVASGLFAKSHGEEFLFFMPQVRVVQSTSGGYNQLPVDVWLPLSPSFWVPIFVVIFGAVVLVLGPKVDHVARRILAAAGMWLIVEYAAFGAWQFLGDGWLFNISYYFSSFLLPTLLCVTAAASVLIGQSASRGAVLVAAASVIVVLTPVAWIYRSDSQLLVAFDYRDDSYVATFLVMGVALVLAVLGRIPRLRAMTAGAVVAAFLAVAYGVDASATTLSNGGSDPRTGALYDAGQNLIRHMRANGYEESLPRFWHDATKIETGIGTIQCLYYYAFTYMDTAMPSITDTFRSRMAAWRPEEIVLLCSDGRCSGAEPALRRAGYKPQLRSLEYVGSGEVRVWVRIYKVDPGA